MKKKLALLISVLLIVLIVGVLITSISSQEEENKEDYTIVTSFYPMYILTKNIVGDTPGIQIVNLTDYESGCLHDYQLTTADMRRLENADLFIMNGGDMESFIEDILTSYPALLIINSSEGIDFLENQHNHDHDHTEHDHEDEEDHADHEDDADHADHDHEDEEDHADHTGHDHEEATIGSSDSHDGHDHGEFNAHVWLNMNHYITQIQNITKELSKYNEANANIYEKNAENYINKVESLKSEFDTALAEFKNKEVVIFHDAFAYMADQLELEVVYTVELDDDTTLSAGEVALIIDEVNTHGIKVLFTEEQYSTSIPQSIAGETGAKVYIIDSGVSGDMDADSYLNAMRGNLEVLQNALQDMN